MDANSMLMGIKSITDSLSDNETAVEAIRAIEQLQMNPEAKAEAISSIIDRTECTKAEAFKQLSSMVQHWSFEEAQIAAKEHAEKDKKKK